MSQIQYYFGCVNARLQTLLLLYCGKSFLKGIPLQNKINLWLSQEVTSYSKCKLHLFWYHWDSPHELLHPSISSKLSGTEESR